MENSLTTRSLPELNGQNIPQNKDSNQNIQLTPELNLTQKFFSVKDLNKLLPRQMNGNTQKQRRDRRYKSERIKKFLSNEENKPLGTIKEIVIDDQNENLVDNNPKKRFMIKETKKEKKEEKKKLSFLEKLREFDRKQQIGFEKYINTIKEKRFRNIYYKTLKNKYEELFNNNSLNNGLFDQGENHNPHQIKENIYNTPAEKDKNDEDNTDDSYEKLKKKYFSANIFSSRFPNSEYKVKFLNNYFNKHSLVKNLFNEKKDMNINTNTNNINSEPNNNNTSPTNICNINFNTSINNSISIKPSIKLNGQNNDNNEMNSPKVIYRNNNELNKYNNSENLNMNNRYSNLNEQSINSNNLYSGTSKKYKSPIKDEIENKYEKVFSSINEKLYKNKYRKKLDDIENKDFIKIPPSDKIKTNSNLYKTNFKCFILDKNKSYNFFRSNLSFSQKLKTCLGFLVRFFAKKIEIQSWYTFKNPVRQRIVFRLNKFSLRFCGKNARIFATAVDTAYALSEIKGVAHTPKFYLIQGFENWDFDDDYVYASYKFPFRKIVIAQWLKNEVEKIGETAVLIQNGLDFDYFSLVNPIESRKSTEIAMLYHTSEIKRCSDAFAAFEIVKKKFPELHVTLFGVYDRPEMLPDWYDYRKSPDKESHNAIYNNAAIFVAPSATEGWGLTPCEAMQCGCAVACTNAGGYLEFAKNEETALVSEVYDVQALANNIIRLIRDDVLRLRIAKAGNEYVKRFTWEKSFVLMRETIENESKS